jgi:hypothetical protein
MIRPPKRHKGSLEHWLHDLDAEASVAAIDAVVKTRAEKVVEIWNARAEPLYYPTFKTALRAGYRWLSFICPACRQVGDVDLAQLDYHPDAAISALIPRLSCSRCCPNPPHARLLQLHRLPMHVAAARRRRPRK